MEGFFLQLLFVVMNKKAVLTLYIKLIRSPRFLGVIVENKNAFLLHEWQKKYFNPVPIDGNFLYKQKWRSRIVSCDTPHNVIKG